MPKTLIRIFMDACARSKPALFMRHAERGWESITPTRALADAEAAGLALRAMGIQPGDRVAILSENRYEWPISDVAILGLGAVTVPIYPTLTAQQVQYILANSEAKVVIVSNAVQLDKLHLIRPQLPALEHVVAMEPSPPLAGEELSFSKLLAQGAELRAAQPNAFRELAEKVRPDDLATIIYTSGTTGEPKGAMLTHGNIASNVEAGLAVMDVNIDDLALSFLPLCHIFERMAGLYCMLEGGATIAYAQSIDTVAQDAMKVKPTIICGVPRFFEKVFARVMENANAQPPLRKGIFFWGLDKGRRVARLGFDRRRPGPVLAVQARIADALVGAKVRSRIGGRIRFCISGGAPLGPKVLEFFFAMGIPILEGYGLTETSPVICVTRFGGARPGSVGPPIPGVEVRIGDDGEILTRGPHVMRGYFRNEEATKAAIRDGWFHTGDVGHLDADGFLHITDRLKDLLVTAGGKKVAPQPLEEKLKTSKWIAEAVLIGDHRPYVVALIVPAFPTLEAEARQHGWKTQSRQELLLRPEVRAIYQHEVDKLNADLAPFEKVKKFALLDRELSQEAGELTPTLKVRRRIVAQKFVDVIEGLFAVA